MAVQVVTTVITRAQEVPCNCSPWWRGAGLVIPANACIAAYTPMGASSLLNSYDNNACPANGQSDGTHDLTVGSTPTWSASDGWTFNGTSHYLITDLNPTTTSLFGVFARISMPTQVGQYGTVIGFYDTDSTSMMLSSEDPGVTLRNTNYLEHNIEPGAYNTFGFHEDIAYVDGQPIGTMIGGGSMANYPLYIGRSGKGADNYYAGKIQAIALYDVELTVAQISALHSSMMALPDYADG